MAKTDRNTSKTSLSPVLGVQVSLDLGSPGVFLSTYQFLLGKEKPNRNRSLINTTKRLVNEYMAAQRDLLQAMCVEAKGLKSWFEKRKQIKRVKARIASIKQKLMKWVTMSIDFFKQSPAVMSSTL